VGVEAQRPNQVGVQARRAEARGVDDHHGVHVGGGELGLIQRFAGEPDDQGAGFFQKHPVFLGKTVWFEVPRQRARKGAALDLRVGKHVEHVPALAHARKEGAGGGLHLALKRAVGRSPCHQRAQKRSWGSVHGPHSAPARREDRDARRK